MTIHSMASAQERAERDWAIRDARLYGASIADIASKFNLSERRIKQILNEAGAVDLEWRYEDRYALAFKRREQRLELYDEVLEFARSLPIQQASAKTGAYRLASETLSKVIDLEQRSGMLPTEEDLQLRFAVSDHEDKRQFIDLIMRVLRLHEAPLKCLMDIDKALDDPMSIAWVKLPDDEPWGSSTESDDG